VLPKGQGHFVAQIDAELQPAPKGGTLELQGELTARGTYDGSQPDEGPIPVERLPG
jgi:hypothetical protein